MSVKGAESGIERQAPYYFPSHPITDSYYQYPLPSNNNTINYLPSVDVQYPLNVSPSSMSHPASEVIISSFPPRSMPSTSFKYKDSADFQARTTMNKYNIRPSNINVNTSNINNNLDSFSPPFSPSTTVAEAKPIILPQYQQAFSQPPNGNKNNNMSSSKNGGKGGENFKNTDDRNDNNNKKRSETLSESDISVNTNKKRLSVDYILT